MRNGRGGGKEKDKDSSECRKDSIQMESIKLKMKGESKKFKRGR